MLTQKQVIQAKLEETPGTAETTGFSDILCFDPKIEDETEMDTRSSPGTYQGPNVPAIPTIPKGIFTGGVELRGNGSGGCDTGLAVLLQCCGLAKTSETYQVYSDESTDKTCTIFGNLDGLKRLIYGVMGNVTLEGETGRKIMCNFDMQGIWGAPTDIALPTASFGSAKPLIFAGGEFKVATVAKKISKFRLDLGTVTILLLDGNTASGIAYATKTNHLPIFSCDFEAELVAANDHFGKKLAGTEEAISIIMKSNTDKATITIPKFQRTEIKEGDLEGRAIFDTSGVCNPSSGDDNVSITFAAA
jgi:hypothetical protein